MEVISRRIDELIIQTRAEFEKAKRLQEFCTMDEKQFYIDALNQAVLSMPKPTDETDLPQKLLLTIKRVNALIAKAKEEYQEAERDTLYHRMAMAKSRMDALDQAREIMKVRLLETLDDL